MLVFDGIQKAMSGAEADTTNNRMELKAVINGLKDMYSHPVWRTADIVFNTDSQYVQRGITEWIQNWERNGWRTKAKNPVKNQYLWKELKYYADKLSVEWRWVRGHSGNPLNELCDKMVQVEIRRISG